MKTRFQPQLRQTLPTNVATMGAAKPVISPVQNKPASAKAISKVNYGSFFGRLYDASIRGVMRYFETSKFSGSLMRIPFRAVSELLRHGTGASLDQIVKDGKVTKAVLFPAARRALENTLATAIIDPNNLNSGRVMRMVAGFANMVVRLAARILLTALDIGDPGDLDMELLGDELIGRTLPRAICTDKINPIIGIGVRAIEQLGINELTNLGPVQKLKNVINNKLSKTTQAV